MLGKINNIKTHNKKRKLMKIILAMVAILFSMQLKAQSAMSDSLITKTLAEARQYLTGIGKQKDETKALSMYTVCVNAGSPKAMNALGIIYKEGIGVKEDKKKAIEWLTKAGNLNYAQAWYNLGLIFKDATITEERNYSKAYDYFCKASDIGDDQSDYAKAYMLYKGLGCTQDYTKASILFEKGARLNRSNSMYFFGLCLRNGYGVEADIDKAKYWLTKASNKNFRLATLELLTPTAENTNNEAKLLVEKLKSVSITNLNSLNTYQKLEQKIPANTIEGNYEGYLIRYDWSGKYAISSSTLKLNLTYKDGQLSGNWIESDSINVPLQATLTPKNMIFKNMQYSKTDHYSMFKALPYNFENAKLQWNKKEDGVYLFGNIQMFSVQRNEPEKPLFIWLKRVDTKNQNENLITLTNEDGSSIILKNDLVAYPNPFDNSITVEFELKESCQVQTELLTMEGKSIYKNLAKLLDVGNYKLQVEPQNLVAGTYLLVLKYGAKIKTTKVIKL
jgi:uncharacterized protein